MTEIIQNIDTFLFYAINKGWSNSFFDKLMPFITSVDSWILIYLFGFYYLLFKSGKKGRLTALALILTILITDQVSSSLIKEVVGRIRPCHTLDDINLLVNCGGGKSFPSSHAANNFAAAMVITYFFRQNYLFLYLVAALVAISRVYVGVHYPLDIITGAILGLVLGFIISLSLRVIDKKFISK